jgi:hypothetical protein
LLIADAKIIDWLAAHPGAPQSVAEIAAAIPGSDPLIVRQLCEQLRATSRVGRNGANTASSPLRYYLKRRLPGI